MLTFLFSVCYFFIGLIAFVCCVAMLAFNEKYPVNGDNFFYALFGIAAGIAWPIFIPFMLCVVLAKFIAKFTFKVKEYVCK